jgi:hypothetical protein
MVENRCRPVVGGNPTVHLDSKFVDSSNLHELDLASNSLTALDTTSSNLLLNTQVVSPTCNEIADPEDATHKSFYNDCRKGTSGDCDHYLMNAWRNPTKPVFGQLLDDSYVLYDTRLELDENTIENPLLDGGGGKVLRSTFVAQTQVFDDSPRPAYSCSNVPQNIFNEEHCKLSFDEKVCVSYDVASASRTLNKKTLRQLFRLTDRYVYAVDGKELTLPNSQPSP